MKASFNLRGLLLISVCLKSCGYRGDASARRHRFDFNRQASYDYAIIFAWALGFLFDRTGKACMSLR